MSELDISGKNRIVYIFRSYNVLFALIITLAFCSFCTAVALAQTDSTAQERSRSDSAVNELGERLGLTDVQVDEIASIIEERNRIKEKLEEKYGGNDETDRLSLMIEMRRLEQEIELRISQVLDEDQMKAYHAYRNEMESLEKKERANVYASDNPRFRELVDRLSLTDEQAADIYPILEDQSRQMRELITDARGKGRQEMSSMRIRMDKLNATTGNRLSRILDEQQMTEYKKYVEEQRARIKSGPVSILLQDLLPLLGDFDALADDFGDLGALCLLAELLPLAHG